MADKSPIEWTDATWNPIVGCSIVSPGCTHCYAMKMAGRIEAMAAVRTLSALGVSTHYAGTTKKVNGNTVWTGKLALAPEKTLLQPLAWRTPRRIFVNSMGDLFHDDVPDEWIDRVFAIMALAPQHTFQVLTKRAKRMREYMTTAKRKRSIATTVMDISEALARQAGTHEAKIKLDHFSRCFAGNGPFSNVWLGVSAERQQEADERVPPLLFTPAAIRFVSAELLLSEINFRRISLGICAGTFIAHPEIREAEFTIDALNGAPRSGIPGLDLIIAGGESGPEARPMYLNAPRRIRDDCAATGKAFFFKQWGAWVPTTAPGDDGPTHWCFPDGSLREIQNAKNWPVDGIPMVRRGKKAAGRLLDGVEHNGMPEMREVPAL